MYSIYSGKYLILQKSFGVKRKDKKENRKRKEKGPGHWT
jgi:hypothetical protein